jgi:putative mRNA 3-end processing factor
LINNFINKTKAGLFCEAGDFYLDPLRAVSNALVSHAHGDHAVATRGNVYCTQPTMSFMNHRHKGKSKPQFTMVHYGQPFKIKNVLVTFYPAGHILGSAQILMEFQNEKYLYTGDFKTQQDDSCEPFEFVECDHLITETTFASPEYHHPEPLAELYSLLNQFSKIVIGAYSLGKAQRITGLLTKNFPSVCVYIHPDLEPYHRLYEQHGFSTGNWKSFRKTDFDRSDKSVYIIPPTHFSRYSSIDVLKVFATGWNRSFYRCDKVLRISDHADWNGVLELISKTKAKTVYTVHGNGTFLRDHLKEKIEVKIIG